MSGLFGVLAKVRDIKKNRKIRLAHCCGETKGPLPPIPKFGLGLGFSERELKNIYISLAEHSYDYLTQKTADGAGRDGTGSFIEFYGFCLENATCKIFVFVKKLGVFQLPACPGWLAHCLRYQRSRVRFPVGVFFLTFFIFSKCSMFGALFGFFEILPCPSG